MLDEHVGDVLFADVEVKGEAAVEVAGEEFHAGGFNGNDDETRAGGMSCYFPEGGGTGLLDFGVGREVFEGEDVVRGEAEDGFGREGSCELAGGEDRGVEGFGGLVVGDDDDGGCGGGANEVGKVEGAGRGGESGDTSAPRATA